MFIGRQSIKKGKILTLITIIDYGMGNPGSIVNMLKYLGIPAHFTSSIEEILNADKLILPGVGAFDAGMTRLHERNMVDILNQKVVKNQTPILGICLGAQLFSKRSDEGELLGLGWIDSEVKRFNFKDNNISSNRFRVPHMGWNEIQIEKAHPLLNGLSTDAKFYFTHSYYINCLQRETVLGTTNYGFRFDSVIGHKNILGVQFHPEKSHRYGMIILKNFAELDL